MGNIKCMREKMKSEAGIKRMTGEINGAGNTGGK